MTKENLKIFTEMEVDYSQEEVLECIKNNTLSRLEKREVAFKAASLGWLKVLKYILNFYEFEENDSLNFALCWATVAPNSKETFDFLMKDERFDLSFQNNEPLIWALQNNANDVITSSEIASEIFENYKFEFTRKNIDLIYESILNDQENTYSKVILLIFSKLRESDDVQNFFELFVAKGYVEEVKEICESSSVKEIDLSIPFNESVEAEDFQMQELLSKYFIPSDDIFVASVKIGNSYIIKNFLKNKKFKFEVLQQGFNIAIEMNNIELAKVLTEYI